MKHYNVVAAAIRYDGRILCMQRGKTKFDYTAFKWEFPGGKIEPGETPQQAIKREIMEEMAMDICVGNSICTVENEYPDFSITMQVFWCTVDSKEFDMKEHNAFKWLEVGDLPQLDWAEADRKVVECLENIGLDKIREMGYLDAKDKHECWIYHHKEDPEYWLLDEKGFPDRDKFGDALNSDLWQIGFEYMEETPDLAKILESCGTDIVGYAYFDGVNRYMDENFNHFSEI